MLDPVEKHRRVVELDILRFFAALFVVLFHFTYRGWTAPQGFTETSFPILGVVTKYGHLGVDLFFLISGFVILMSVQGRSSAEFAISRFVRLYPTYWVCLIISALVIVVTDSPTFQVSASQLALNFTMIQEAFGVESVESVYWTLLVELKFYFLVLITLLLGLRKQFVGILFLWLLIAAYQNFVAPITGLYRLTIPEWAGYFVAGSAFFLALQSGWNWRVGGLVLGGYVLCLYNLEVRIAPAEVLTSQIIVSMFFLLFFGIVGNWFQRFQTPVFLHLGALTYPLYLVHETIGYLLINYFSAWNRFAALAIVIVITLIIAAAIVYCFERPVLGKLRKALEQLANRRLPKFLRTEP